jgi:hypothetical protein
MNNPRHVEALKLFSAQPDKMRSEFIIDCIRQTVSNALAGISLHVSDISDSPPKIQPTENISDLPDELVASMNDI